jgi:MFS transporter, AAHS family, 4-hydroxybenzoate transporter
MNTGRTIDIGQLVDEQKLSRFNVTVLAWSLLVLLMDGYDLNAIAVVAPDIVKAWQIDRAALGLVFSMGLVGVALGAPVLGHLGDKFGRKKAIILGCCLYGFFSLATAAATSLDQLIVLRFLVGLGLGGAIPNIYVLAAEFAPKKFRAAFAVLAGMGITLGASSVGPIYAALVPHFGWPAIFIIGGIVPIVIAIGVYFFVPESLKFLALRSDRRAEITRIATIIRPGLPIGPDTVFSAAAKIDSGILPRRLFSYGLAFITSLLWIVFLMQNATNFFVNMWMTTLFREAGMAPAQAALTQSMYFLGANFGTIVMALLLGRFGMAAIAGMVMLYLPTIAGIGTPGLPADLLKSLVFVAGLCNGAIYGGLGATAAIIYPTAIRANGTGWALGVGRIGAIAGPLIGGALLARHMSTQNLFLVLLIPLSIAVAASLTLLRLCYVRFGGLRFHEAAAAVIDETKAPTAPVANQFRPS